MKNYWILAIHNVGNEFCFRGGYEKLGQLSYSPRQKSAWCKTVIRNCARNLRKKRSRWNRDLLILNTQDEYGEEVQDKLPAQFAEYEFSHIEWNLMLNEVLTSTEQCVINGLYIADHSQRDIAKQCFLSQSRVVSRQVV